MLEVAPMAIPEASDHPAAPSSERRVRELTPDDEALLLLAKIVERAAVAKSLAKLATGFVLGTAAAKVKAVGLDSRLDRVRKIARAATEAAVHVATHPAPAPTEDEPPQPKAP